MTNHKNETAMRAAGKAYMSAGASVIAILRTLATDKPDEAYINTLKFEFYLGGMLTVEPDEAKARAYLPDDNIVIKNDRCAFAPFDPSKATNKPQRPERIEQVYHQMRSNWSNWRNVAGLPSLRAPPRQGNAGGAGGAGGETTETEDMPIAVKALAVPTGANTKAIVAQVKAFDGWLTATLATNGTRVRGDAGELLRKIEIDLHAYVADLVVALERDAIPAPIAAVVRQSELEAMVAKLQAELAAAQTKPVKPTKPVTPAKVAKAASA